MLVRIQSLLLVLALAFIAIEHAPWSQADASPGITKTEVCRALYEWTEGSTLAIDPSTIYLADEVELAAIGMIERASVYHPKLLPKACNDLYLPPR